MDSQPDHQNDSSGPDTVTYDDPGSDVGGFDWDDPAAFFRAINAGKPGAVPMPELKTPAEVRREARARSDKISASYGTLHEILKRHEATIHKRWFKKTRPQRLKILLTAWPNMPTMHRPDFDAFRKETELDRCNGTKYREYFMWPYINQEDLLTTKTLPLLLNARGRHHPYHFAAADIEAIHFGIVTKAVVPSFLNHHVMILNGVTGHSREYGKLMAWEEHPDALDWMCKQKQFHPGDGLMVLETQERLLAFLVQCCLQLLHDIPRSALISDSFPVLPEPQLKSESGVSGFNSLSVMAAEAPYRVPAQLDLRRLESLLAARATAAEDHLWSLREAPDYFASTLLESKHHRLEILEDLNGNDHPVLRGRAHAFWGRVIGLVVSDAHLAVELFSELRSQVEKLTSLQRQYADDISPSKDLPEEYLEALLLLRLFVDRAAKGPLSILEMAVAASPPLRRFFARRPPPDAHTTRIQVEPKPGVKIGDVEPQLLWLLHTLLEDGEPLYFATLPLIVDELERLVQSEKQARELLSPYISAIIGDLSIFSQCLNQLNLYQPWARSFDNEFVDRKDQLEKEYAERTRPRARMFSVLSETSESNNVVSLGEPSGAKFTYLVEKRRTKENVEALRRAEANLDAFWAIIDQAMRRKAGDWRGTAVRNLLSQRRILQRTQEWVEPAISTSAQDRGSAADLYTSYQPLSSVYLGLPATKLEVAQPKVKVKTRGTSRAPARPLTEPEPVLQPSQGDPQLTVSVDARALKVFRTIFFNPEVNSTPGEIPWNDFLHAMTSVGFTAMKLYGSVWQFQPTKLDVERSIQFHEPHPRGKIPFTTARRYGRRLHRAYGWLGGMFTLRAP